VYIGYDLCHHGCPVPKSYLSILTPVTARSNPRQLLHTCQVYHDANLVTAGQFLAEVMHI